MTGGFSRGNERSFDVLLVEENPDEVAPFIESFESTDTTEEVHVVSDGDEALDFLHRHEPYEGAPRPDLIILDLHVSGTSGEDVLVELNDRSELRRIPVLVLTASDEATDVARSYELNANAYLQKPTTSDEFVSLARTIEEFWLRLASLPPK